MSELQVRGTLIPQDEHGYLSLTEMWRLSGKSQTKAPRHWRVLPSTRELVAALMDDVRFSDVIQKSREKSAIYTKRGRGSTTFAHVILALAYAEYLSPELGIEVREIALRVWSGDVTVLDDFTQSRRRQRDDDETRVFLRDETAAHNTVLNERLRGLGATRRHEYANFHDAGYRGLYDGLDENAIHRLKRLKKGERILDYMTTPEAAANLFRTTQAELHLRAYPVESVSQACSVHHRAGEVVREAMRQMQSPMPEEMPVAEPLSEAKKRLKTQKGRKIKG